MFAYNEQNNISDSLKSVYNNKNASLRYVYLIANGCTDKTAECAEQLKADLNFTELNIISITLGDKCNAWNHYIHHLADEVDCHFFIDADVNFSDNCFELMHNKLINSKNGEVAIAGLPISGRNIDFYRSLVMERACFFGNLYGLKHNFIQSIREAHFHLPIGLNWIDSFLTKAVNTNLTFGTENLPNRVTYLEGSGYYFDSLSIFSRSDIKLYIDRIARYELGKVQESYLDKLSREDWPESMHSINHLIKENFVKDTAGLGFIKKHLVKNRLAKLFKKYANQ
jgi:glycosyltransferase involved in cell wall biosynthesis